MSKIALITGITGQDGSFLAEFLLEKGYEVHGIIRRSSSFNTGRIEHLYIDELLKDMHITRKVQLHYGDMTDSTNHAQTLRKQFFPHSTIACDRMGTVDGVAHRGMRVDA